MKFWTFFDPHPELPPDDKRALEIVAVKEGIAWWALLVPVIWLAWHKLWLELVFVFALFVAIGASLSFLPVSPLAIGFVHILMNLAVALLGNDLRCRKLERKGYKSIAVLAGQTQLEAEALFFDIWARPEEYQKHFGIAQPVAPAATVALENV